MSAASSRSQALIDAAGGRVGVLHETINGLVRDLSALNGECVTAANGNPTAWLRLGDAEVLVEYELEEHDADPVPLCAYLNGRWVDMSPEYFTGSLIERWSRDVREQLQREAAAVEESHAEDVMADRRWA